jgi:L-alanine-DL-glutamate epimerase-like enolase superfamily enzyme
MGELFNSPHEWIPLISERLIDYMRMHVSQIGGLTPARKLAAMAETLGVRTAWHGPPPSRRAPRPAFAPWDVDARELWNWAGMRQMLIMSDPRHDNSTQA